jgi:hypothetical protein
MGDRVAFTLACCAVTLIAAGGIASCGARTALVDDEDPNRAPGGDAGKVDSGRETGVPSPDRVVPDVLSDVVAEDALPPIDAFKNDVAVINPCPDAAATLIYVIGSSSELYSFDPAAGTFTPIGPIDCPGSIGSPFSMAVDREGTAYVVFSNGGLFRVSTKTAACTPTAYDAKANGNITFGMGFVANVGDGADAGETLFVAEDRGGVETDGELASLDTSTFVLSAIGDFTPNPPGVPGAELTGTGDGRLYAFSPNQPGSNEPSFIAQIDPSSAAILGVDVLPDIVAGAGWAFGFWGGDFYTFTGTPSGARGTVVNRFDPAILNQTTVVARITDDTIVGAGVSTCAPQN